MNPTGSESPSKNSPRSKKTPRINPYTNYDFAYASREWVRQPFRDHQSYVASMGFSNIPRSAMVKLFVANVAYTVTDAELRKMADEDTAIVELSKEDGRSKGYGFILVPDNSTAHRVIERLNKIRIAGRDIRCHFSRDKEQQQQHQQQYQQQRQFPGGRERSSSRSRSRSDSRGRSRSRRNFPKERMFDKQHMMPSMMDLPPHRIVQNRNPALRKPMGIGTTVEILKNPERSEWEGCRAQITGGPLNGDSWEVSFLCRGEEVVATLPAMCMKIWEDWSLFVGQLSYLVTEDMLKNVFSKHLEVGATRIVRDATGASRGHGFVDVSRKELMQIAIARMDGSELCGRRITVKLSDRAIQRMEEEAMGR